MKILVAESNPTGRKLLEQMLRLDGHEVVLTESGREALDAFRHHKPDLVLLDVSLPDLDGYTCSREIKHRSEHRFVPVILSTSVRDHLTLSRFLDSEADDFIDEPYNHLILKAKLKGFARVRDLYHRLERYRTATDQEIKLAKYMFDSVTRRTPEDLPHLRHWSLTAGHFSGDLLIYERTPDDHLHILLGDFTGHGLAAAVGALPASDVFFAMTRKGFHLEEIMAEINRKLYELLPTGHFCAACAVSLAPDASSLKIWNGGLPPVLLIDEAHRVINRVGSGHLPLGILPPEDFSRETETVRNAALHIVLYSDGLVEAQNPRGEQFGDARLEEAVLRHPEHGHLLDGIKAHVIDFLGGMEPHDDISLLAIHLAP